MLFFDLVHDVILQHLDHGMPSPSVQQSTTCNAPDAPDGSNCILDEHSESKGGMKTRERERMRAGHVKEHRNGTGGVGAAA